MKPYTFIGATSLLALALLAGCSGAGAASIAPITVDSRVSVTAPAPSELESTVPAGKGPDVASDSHATVPTPNRIDRLNAAVMTGIQKLTFIWLVCQLAFGWVL